MNIGRGVIQGGVLSPQLFVIMFNDLLDKLEEQDFEIFAYADDLAMIGKCKANLLDAINIVEAWTEENKLTINKKKSGVMIHRYRGKAAKTDKGFIRGFPYKTEYTYLGIVIDRNLTMRNHL